MYKLHTLDAQHIEWKKVKYVLRNKSGYIIPMTGFGNAGKFMWIPDRSLHSTHFSELANMHQVPIKALK